MLGGEHQLQQRRIGRIDLEDLTLQRRPYRPLAAYGQSKLANLLFAAELQRRLVAVGSSVLSMAAHPGVAATDLTARNPGRGRLDRAVEPVVLRLVGHDAEGGALPMLQAALADLPGGSYVGPQGLLGTRGAPGPAGRSRRAQDVEMARRLWEVSAELTGADFPLVRDPLTR